MKIALCLLTLNEINGCKHDIPLIKKIGNNFDEIFVVDNGSTDGTIEFLKKKKIKVFSVPGVSYNEQHAIAIEKTKSDAVIFFPPKGTNSVNDTLKFKKLFDEGYDLIVASRVIKGGKNEDDRHLFKPRKWLTIALALLSAARWRREGNIILDCLHVFRGTTVKSFKKSKIYRTGQTFDIDEIIKSYIHKTRRIEFPTTEKPRKSGKTHFKTIPFGIKIFKYFFKEALKIN
jgi:glycosyltransferase involved in cell wall biosynthesis